MRSCCLPLFRQWAYSAISSQEQSIAEGSSFPPQIFHLSCLHSSLFLLSPPLFCVPFISIPRPSLSECLLLSRGLSSLSDLLLARGSGNERIQHPRRVDSPESPPSIHRLDMRSPRGVLGVPLHHTNPFSRPLLLLSPLWSSRLLRHPLLRHCAVPTTVWF